VEFIAVALPVAFVIIVLVAIAVSAIKIVNQYERLLVFTLGRTSPNEVKGPGWVFIVPIAQRGVRVDLRERFIASWTSRGGVISRISTVVTLPPQRSVTSSSLTRRTSLI